MTAHENSPGEPVAYPKKQILEKYEKFAPWYDLVEGVPDLLGLRKLRRRLLEKASGKVLQQGGRIQPTLARWLSGGPSRAGRKGSVEESTRKWCRRGRGLRPHKKSIRSG